MKKIYRYVFAASFIVASLTGCEKGFLDINSNPNSPVQATPALVLSAGLNRTATSVGTTLNVLGSIWSGQWAPPTDFLFFNGEKQYNITNGFYTGIWETGYDNLNDYQYIEKAATDASMPNYAGIAKIMKAVNFQILVDAYNNVPFTDALKGTEQIRPKYDDAQKVYEGCMTLLDDGIKLIKAAPATSVKPSTDDIIFAGNMTRWVKFANTVKLRMLLRQSEIPSRYTSYIQGEIAKIVAEGSGFLGAGESALANPGYVSSSGKLNPFWENYYQSAAGAIGNNYKASRATVYVLQKYDDYNDPRKARLYATVTGGGYKGVELGRNTGDAQSTLYKSNVTSAFLPGGALLKSATQPTVILSSMESLFLQAEATERGWLTGSAITLYNTAITESFTFDAVPSAATAAATYYAQPIDNVGYATSTDKIKAIIVQKWLALNTISGWEVWNDFRRTKFPSDNPISLAAITPKHPARLLYPSSEAATNGDQVVAQGTINPFDSKIFWDKK